MRLILSFFSIFLLFSCQPTTEMDSSMPDGTQMAEEGYFYKIHVDAEGALPEVGELSVFNLTQRFDDSIVYRSLDRGRAERLPIPDGARTKRKKSPVVSILEKLSAGDSATVYVPIDSLGANIQPWQKDKEFLIYDISILEVINTKAKENEVATMVAETVSSYRDGSLENIKTLENGLKYIIHKEGEGVLAEAGQVVSVDYFGVLASDGSMFDNSFGRGDPFRFPLGAGRVIKGWDAGIPLLNKGATATFFIPGDLAYGAAGSPPKIPADAELVFYVELKDIE